MYHKKTKKLTAEEEAIDFLGLPYSAIWALHCADCVMPLYCHLVDFSGLKCMNPPLLFFKINLFFCY